MLNLPRITVVARNVFLEVIRDRILYLAGLFAVVMVLAAVLLPEVAAGTDNKILLDLGLAAINLFTLVVVVFVGTGLVNKEIEKKTVLVLIAKPVSRFEIILGKHLGLAAVTGLLMLVQTGIFIIILTVRQLEFPAGSMLVAIFFMYLEMLLIIAITIVFGVFTSSLLATLLSFGTYLVGHLSTDLLKLSQVSKSEGLQRVVEAMYLVLPDLERLNLKNEAVYGAAVLPGAGTLAMNALYGLIYTALLLVIAGNVFTRRQF
ncbi:ABC transporter permease [Leptothoe sp. PORK10 BA2]|uniref:ABC transporter permease n=1 Tax=Leptothoe sp. PORK10 BA2 TaxID=3110254 RepID=UPI002B20DF69|nr:ABC transporter permease subunit [Leptothoe sp. PORK10 BA2]MEA5465879.1 ABC transporter permease subunit [Leptothoe sp. PORK10 BA2]